MSDEITRVQEYGYELTDNFGLSKLFESRMIATDKTITRLRKVVRSYVDIGREGLW